MNIPGNQILRYMIKAASAGLFAVLNRFFRMFPMKEEQVLFLSDVRAEMGGNFAFVENAMPSTLHSKYYLKADRRDFFGFADLIRLSYDISTSKYILLEDYFRYISYMRVREGQQLCQLWHAAGAYKKFGYSRAGNNEKIKIHKGYRKYTKVIVSAAPIRKDYAEAFGISEDKVQATGVPRTDVFFDETYISKTRESLYQEFPALKDRKVVLFAPTYRGLRAEDAGYDFDRLDLDRLYEALRDEYVFVFKWHPAAYNNIRRGAVKAYDLTKYGDFFLDLSAERDINDLLFVTDILVTDYSSVIFDYSLRRKPIIYFTYDLEKYNDGRGMYYSFDEYVYGPVVRTTDALIEAIRHPECDAEQYAAFYEKFMAACDGHATERTCNWLFKDSAPSIKQ